MTSIADDNKPLPQSGTHAARILAILQDTRSLLNDKSRWTQRTYARTAPVGRGDSGNDVASTSDDACSWCLVGAVGKVVGDRFGKAGGSLGTMSNDGQFYGYAARDYLREAIQQAGYPTRAIAMWNDSPERDHAEVVRVLDRAVANAKQQTIDWGAFVQRMEQVSDLKVPSEEPLTGWDFVGTDSP